MTNERCQRRRFRGIICAAVVLIGAILCSGGCSKETPSSFGSIDAAPNIYPEYADVVVPINIAPMNFDVVEEGEETRVFVYPESFDSNASPLFAFSNDKARFPLKKWRKTLKEHAGKKLAVAVFVKRDGKWLKFNDIHFEVSTDPIDPYVSYRLVGPGYERFCDLSIQTRDIESFKTRELFRAPLVSERACINCHNFQNRKTENFFFHLRLVDGGTIFVENGDDVSKRDMQADGLDGGCSYAAWRPNSKHVAFIANWTQQVFRHKSLDRIDVLDYFGDMYLYDVDRNVLSPITPKGDDSLECFPNWSQDGSALYYCSYDDPNFQTHRFDEDAFGSSLRGTEIMKNREKIHYKIKRVNFDERTGTFSEPEVVFDAAAMGKSALFPKVSPDGKTMIVTLTEFGCFPIWYRDSDLWAVDLETGESRAIDEINAPDASDSYHCWDSSGKWLVFSSRREDGSYTRLYFTRRREDGTFTKPFLLPQEAPEETLTTTASYNVPEFTVEPVRVSERKLLKAATQKPEAKAKIK